MTGPNVPSVPVGPPREGAAETRATPSVAAALERALAEHLFAGRTTADLGHALVALLALYLFRGVVAGGVALAWAVLFAVSVLARGMFRRLRIAHMGEAGRRLRAVRVEVWISGGLWGLGSLGLIGAEIELLALLLVIFAGLTAAATSTLVADGGAFRGFTLALLVPAFATVLASGRDATHLAMAAMIAVYGPFMATVFRRAHGLLVDQIVNAERLRESREEAAQGRDFLDAIFASAPSAIVVLGADGAVRRSSPALERILGYTSGEVDGRPLEELVPDAAQRDRLRAFLERARTSHAASLEIPMRRAVGDLVWMRLSGTAAKGLEDALIVVGEDVSEQIVARETRERARVAAEQATRAKSSFLASMSHEIRTPMNGILGMIELLLDSDLTPEQRESAEIIRSSGRGLLRILNDILDVSKMEAGQLDLEAIDFDLREAIHEVAHLHRMAANARGIALDVDVDDVLPAHVRGDPVRLRQVLSNLVGNALKFTEEGRVRVRVEPADAAEGVVRFSVTDTGIGIAADKLETIFDEFEQGDKSTTRRYGGAGLGLAISRRLLSLMGGRIEVSSTPGQGSRFSFTVPLPAAEARRGEERRSAPASISAKHYLLVSRAPAERRLVREILLRAHAAGVVEVGEEEQALAELRAGGGGPDGFSVLVVDHAPPELDALRLARATTEERRGGHTRILALATEGGAFGRDELLQAGIAGVLTKPITRSGLLGALNELVQWTGHDGPERRLVTDTTKTRPSVQARILLVEDNAVNRQVALSLLRKRGYEVTTAEDGRAAVEIAGREPFDLVLMDIQMPVMDGFEATTRLRAMPAHGDTPIAALTAHAFQEERDRCVEVGMDDFLAKPFAPADLYDLVERWTGPDGRRRAGAPAAAAATPRAAEREVPRPVDVDAFRAAMRSAGVEDVVDATLRVYTDEAPTILGRIEAAAAAGDAVALRAEAHSLKSASANIRANRLAELLRRLEHMGRDGDLDAAGGLVPEVRTELTAALEQIRGGAEG